MTVGLIYHDIAPPGEADRYGFPGPVAARYKLDPQKFEAHLDALAATSATVDLVTRSPQAAITFDDGGASALSAAEALERRGWRGHFFVTTARIDTPGFLRGDEVRDLARRGHDVGSHSHTHPTYMGAISRDAIADEWRTSREVLGELLGSVPETAAVPGGFLSPVVIDEAGRAGYRLLMTSQPTIRVATYGEMQVRGRYTIWARTSASRAAAYVQGSCFARSSLWVSWQAKTAPKRISPRAYEQARRVWAMRDRRR